jgi:integrase
MRRITIGRWPDLSLNEARAEALRIRHDIAIGFDPSRKREEDRFEMTLGNIAQRYLEEHSKRHKRSWLDDDRRIRMHIRPLAELKISEISRETVTRWHHRIGNERGRFQANRCLALLSAIFGWAIRFGHFHGENPAKGIHKFREDRRSRFLNAAELSRLWKVLDAEASPQWCAYFKLALLLGMRKNELLRARWEHVNLAEALWTLPVTKTDRPHTLPIPQAAIEILQGLPSRDTSPWLFPRENRPGQRFGSADGAWVRIRARAGLPDVRIHDLRRTLGSWLATQGCSLPLIGRALNHTNVATTQIYARMNLDPVREALERNASLMLDSKNRAQASEV